MTNELTPSHDDILLEEMRSNLKVVLENTATTEERLMNRINEFQAYNNRRFDDIMLVLREHTRLHQENLKRWVQNDKRWIAVEERFERTEERLIRIEDRLTRVEDRLSRVEGKLDHVHYRVEQHDQAIVALRSS